MGGPPHAHQLLEPLLALCTIDETTVRVQAVDAINTLGKQLAPEQILQHLAPRVLELFESAEWFTPRVSACGLVALAYSGCKGSKKDATTTYSSGEKEKTYRAEDLARELAEAYRKQFSDTEPMVRRSAAIKLADASLAFGEEVTKTELVSIFCRLVDESEQESIRVNALKSAATIFRVASLTDVEAAAGEKYLACASDKSWRVRVAVSESLSAVAAARRSAKGGADEAEVELCQTAFLQALVDHEAEVRHATAAQSAAAASVLGPQFTVDHLVPEVRKLVHDDGVANRVDLAGVLVEMAGPIGMPLAREVFLLPGSSGEESLSLLQSLMNDPNTNLRLAVIGKLVALIDVLTIPQAGDALEIIQTLIDDKNWRIRHAALKLLPTLASHMAVDDFTNTFIQTAFKSRAEDNCALIRNDWILCCKDIGAVYGSEWIQTHVLPTLNTLTEMKNYQFKSVFLHGLAELGGHGLAEGMLPSALSMVEDRVPNLRLMAAQTLGVVALGTAGQAWVPADVVKDKVAPVLGKLAEDTDVDVREMASAALDRLP